MTYDDIKIVESHKYLGVILANNLSLKLHCDNVITKASRALFILRYIRTHGFISKQELFNVYSAFVVANLSYASPLLVSLSRKDISRFDKLIKRCHKIICGNLCACDNFENISNIISKRNVNFLNSIRDFSPIAHYVPCKLPSGRFFIQFFKCARRQKAHI